MDNLLTFNRNLCCFCDKIRYNGLKCAYFLSKIIQLSMLLSSSVGIVVVVVVVVTSTDVASSFSQSIFYTLSCIDFIHQIYFIRFCGLVLFYLPHQITNNHVVRKTFTIVTLSTTINFLKIMQKETINTSKLLTK